MAGRQRIVRMTLAEARKLVAEGKGMTDWGRVDAMIQEELEDPPRDE